MAEHREGDWIVALTQNEGGSLTIRWWRADDLPVTREGIAYDASHKRGRMGVMVDKDRYPDGRHKLPR